MRKISMLMLGASLLGFGLVGRARADQVPGSQTTEIANQVDARLQKDADLKNNRVQTSVDNGVVTLTGTVDTDAEKTKAAKLAMVKGVSRVDNQLKVGSEGVRNTVTDATITGRLKTELMGEDALRAVHVETNNAVVTLSGTVPSEAARMRTLELARSLTGVSRVEDNVKVAPSSSGGLPSP